MCPSMPTSSTQPPPEPACACCPPPPAGAAGLLPLALFTRSCLPARPLWQAMLLFLPWLLRDHARPEYAAYCEQYAHDEDGLLWEARTTAP